MFRCDANACAGPRIFFHHSAVLPFPSSFVQRHFRLFSFPSANGIFGCLTNCRFSVTFSKTALQVLKLKAPEHGATLCTWLGNAWVDLKSGACTANWGTYTWERWGMLT